MERDLAAEIDGIKEELKVISAILQSLGPTDKGPGFQIDAAESPLPPGKRIRVMKRMHPTPEVAAIMERLCETAEGKGYIGAITYLGVFESGSRQSNWIRSEVDVGGLLSLVEDDSAEAVLRCLGNNTRLNLLLTLLRAPMSAAQLVEKGVFTSTGQAYHHLKPLLAADLIHEAEQGERGVYAVRPHRVQGIVMLLAGISDMLDPTYTQGVWEEDGEGPHRTRKGV